MASALLPAPGTIEDFRVWEARSPGFWGFRLGFGGLGFRVLGFRAFGGLGFRGFGV